MWYQDSYDTLRRTARTEQQDPFVRQSEAKVLQDVPGQSRTVGIVGANAAVLEGQEIGGFGVFGLFLFGRGLASLVALLAGIGFSVDRAY